MGGLVFFFFFFFFFHCSCVASITCRCKTEDKLKLFCLGWSPFLLLVEEIGAFGEIGRSQLGKKSVFLEQRSRVQSR